ncbi:hypothetical protein AAFH68_36280 [Flavobacterium sp. CGRL1]|jgi:hypothetical protein
MIKNYKIKLLVIISLCTLLYNCSKDESYINIDKEESSLLTRSKEWLSTKQSINKENVNWDFALVYQQSKESSYVAIIPIKSENNFLLQKLVLEINPYNITGKLWSFNFKDSQEIDKIQMISTHKILESFTGELEITNLETMETRNDLYKLGIADNNILFSKSNGTGVCDRCHLVGDEGAIKLDEVVVTGPGGSPWPNPITEPIFPPMPPFTGGSGGTPSAWNKVEQINDDQLDPCGKSSLDRLKNLKQNDITKMLQRFGSSISPYDVSIQKGPTPLNPNGFGSTIRISRNNYQIIINQDYLNGVTDLEPNSPPTDLSVATTIVHELIHAYFLSLVDQYQSSGSSPLTDFPTLFEAYVRSTQPGSTSNDLADAHHAEIANWYIDIMASTLQEFNTGTPVTQSANIQQIYKDLAWSTLQGTPIYNAKLTAAEKERIQKTQAVEAKNKSRGSQNPTGKPCK